MKIITMSSVWWGIQILNLRKTEQLYWVPSWGIRIGSEREKVGLVHSLNHSVKVLPKFLGMMTWSLSEKSITKIFIFIFNYYFLKLHKNMHKHHRNDGAAVQYGNAACHCSYFIRKALSFSPAVNTVIAYLVDKRNLGNLPVHKGVPYINAGWTVPTPLWPVGNTMLTQSASQRRTEKERLKEGWISETSEMRTQRFGW